MYPKESSWCQNQKGILVQSTAHKHTERKKEGAVSGLARLQNRFHNRERPIHIIAIVLFQRRGFHLPHLVKFYSVLVTLQFACNENTSPIIKKVLVYFLSSQFLFLFQTERRLPQYIRRCGLLFVWSSLLFSLSTASTVSSSWISDQDHYRIGV